MNTPTQTQPSKDGKQETTSLSKEEAKAILESKQTEKVNELLHKAGTSREKLSKSLFDPNDLAQFRANDLPLEFKVPLDIYLILKQLLKLPVNIKNLEALQTNNQNQKIMDTPTQTQKNEKESINKLDFLQKQLKYRGFTLSETDTQKVTDYVNSNEQKLTLNTTSDKTHFDNKMDYVLNFNKGEKGGVFFNSFQATLTKKDGEELTHKFSVGKKPAITAKEALNLLEGRSVKAELVDKTTGEEKEAFIKLKLKDPKTDYGNFKMEVFNKNYGVIVDKIIDQSRLLFDNPDHKAKTIRSLERGNIVAVKFDEKGKTVKGNAVLNPQYKALNLYDSFMNRLNLNKPQGLEQSADSRSQKVKQHTQSRGI